MGRYDVDISKCVHGSVGNGVVVNASVATGMICSWRSSM